MDRHHNKVVEFVGYAGSGKTFLKNSIKTQLGSRAIDISDIELDKKRFSVYILTNPASVALCVLVVLYSKPRWETFKKSLHLFLTHEWRIQRSMRRDTGTDYVLSEEGYFHKLRRLRQCSRLPSFNYRDIPKWVRKRLFKSDYVIIIDAQIETIVKRRLSRADRAINENNIRDETQRIEKDVSELREGTREDIRDAEKELNACFLEFDNEDGSEITTVVNELTC